MLRSYATFFTLPTEWRFINLIRFYYFLILELVFPCYSDPFDKSLHGCFSETVLPGMCSFRVVKIHPRIKIGLQLFDRCIDFLSECDSIELILHSSVKSLTDTIYLWDFRLNPRMINVLHSQIQFILVIFPVSAVFRPSVCEHTH